MSKALCAILAVLLLVSCAGSATTPTPTLQSVAQESTATSQPVATDTAAPTATATDTPTSVPPTDTPIPPTPTPVPMAVWFDPGLPPMAHDRVVMALEGEPAGLAPDAEQADLRIGWGMETTLGQWVYAVAAPFPTLADAITWQEVQRFWAGESALTVISEDGQTPTLFVTQETLAALEHLLGPLSDQAPVSIQTEADIVTAAWDARPHAWAIVPFDQLQPRWKVLRLDGMNVLDKQTDMGAYPLALTFGAEGEAAEQLAAALANDEQPLTNRDTARMTTLVMTGVTALVRATAHEMEVRGVLYPGELINPILRAADITHISNEIPFANNCPPPNRNQEELVFCSDPRYIELLRNAGADLIELTGNHFQDYGSQATLDTLEMYRQEGWPYYGGGENLADAKKPITIESNGNSFSFIGCNPVGPIYAWATETEPGAAPCDFEYMHAELARLREEVDVPIATWQYWEHYFYEATEQQQADFRGMVDAGARIVSGSQAHHPQAYEFYKDGFIHYGLGNLFFDQMWSLGTRQETVDRHTIYDGRHLSTEVLTFMLENYAQPRPMTIEERRALLQSLFQASGW
ncbi:MAG: CapA family protein [Chloroflexi bacterium]|jgi:hypothetical protein|nr:CapA family protein [Chloroflexota bacterium]